MRIDVIIPTFNRAELLRRTLASLASAVRPAGFEVRVTVVDNNSNDHTRLVVDEWRDQFQGALNYLFEARQGRSHALNAGIRATSAEIVGMIDDDEEVCAGWFVEAHRFFSRDDVDFIGGPYLPRWGADPPEWLPASYRGVIGWVENGGETAPFNKLADAILMGGNALVRRSVFEKTGLYSTALGRTDKRLLSCEDEEFYFRLVRTGARGFYVPDLIIHHFIPPERMTKAYHRSWCFWRGVSLGVIERERSANVAYLVGVPRYLWGNALRGGLRSIGGFLNRTTSGDRFGGELAIWDLAGMLYGRHRFVKANEQNNAQLKSVERSASDVEYLKRGVSPNR